MKVIILESESTKKDLLKFGSDLLNKVKETCSTIIYDKVSEDFSNIPELKDNEEKILLYNPYCIDGDFSHLTKHLPTFKNVKYLFSPYSYYTDLDLELLRKMGIKYRNNAGANAKSVAQLAITVMFMLLSRVPQLGYENKEPSGEILGEELDNKTIGIIGMGNVGKTLADKFKKLGIPSVFYNRTAKEMGISQVDLEEVFNQDIVFLTIAKNEETAEMLKNIFSLIKKHQYLIDISAYDDFYDKHKMIEMLKNNSLTGYAFETSNPQNYRTSDKLNLVITPHMAWSTLDAESNVARHYLNRTLKVLGGKVDDIDFIV